MQNVTRELLECRRMRRRRKRGRGEKVLRRDARGLTIPGCRNVRACGANHEFIANSLRIFQVISPVMSKGYASDDERVRCHGGTKVNHLSNLIFLPLSPLLTHTRARARVHTHALSLSLSLSLISFLRSSNSRFTIHPPYMD